MTPNGNSALKKKVEGEFSEETLDVGKLVRTLIESFLKSDSNYGAITDIKTDTNNIYGLVNSYIDEERLDIYALRLADRILLSKTNVDFENLYGVIKEKAHLQIKKDMIEIWDDPGSKILHLIVVPVRKHFPIDYATSKDKSRIIEKISSMTWSISTP